MRIIEQFVVDLEKAIDPASPLGVELKWHYGSSFIESIDRYGGEELSRETVDPNNIVEALELIRAGFGFLVDNYLHQYLHLEQPLIEESNVFLIFSLAKKLENISKNLSEAIKELMFTEDEDRFLLLKTYLLYVYGVYAWGFTTVKEEKTTEKLDEKGTLFRKVVILHALRYYIDELFSDPDQESKVTIPKKVAQ